MKRNRSSTVAVALPTQVDTGTEGYFQNGDPGTGTPATQLDQAWFNGVTEEIRSVIVDVGGATPSGTDLAQMATALRGARAIEASAAGGSVAHLQPGTTRSIKALIAASSCYADGTGNNVAMASSAARAQGARSAAIASQASAATCGAFDDATNCGVIGCDDARLGVAAAPTTNGFAGGCDDVALAGTDVAAFASKNCDIIGTGNESMIGASENCSITTAAQAAILASQDVVANGGVNAAAIACDGGSADGMGSATVASQDSGSDGTNVLTAASLDTETDGLLSAAIGCNDALVPGGITNAVVLASKSVELAEDYCVGGGYDAGALTPDGTNQNLDWILRGNNAQSFETTGTHAQSADPNNDFAEMFENAEPGDLPVGSLLTRVGRKVRAAKPGDRLVGVVSAAPAFLCGTGGIAWAKKFAVDEWGRPVFKSVDTVRWPDLYTVRPKTRLEEVTDADGVITVVQVPDGLDHVKVRERYSGPVADAPTPIPTDAAYGTMQVRVLSDAYDPTRKNVPRTERPAEWTPVALVGQVPVRIGPDVQVDDVLEAGPKGCAVATKKPKGRTVEVMEITVPYTAERGYGIAICLVVS